MTSIIYIIIAIVLYMVIYTTLNNAPFFQDAYPGVTSICVTALCVIGIHQVFRKTELDFFLLLHAVLGIALLSVLLLRGLSSFRNSKNVDLEKEIPSKTNPDWRSSDDKTE